MLRRGQIFVRAKTSDGRWATVDFLDLTLQSQVHFLAHIACMGRPAIFQIPDPAGPDIELLTDKTKAEVEQEHPPPKGLDGRAS